MDDQAKMLGLMRFWLFGTFVIIYSLRIRNYVPISSASCTNSNYRAK